MNAVPEPLPASEPTLVDTSPVVPAAPFRAVDYPFEFTGDAKEFFRIWIVNLALSIVTLGIYSAWSKVRTNRYFYANTRVAGAPFEYLAKPIPILKGRLIAFVLFGSYVISGHIFIPIQLGLLVVIALVAPWLIVRGARFRARYSAWRSIHFAFVGSYGQAYVNYLLLYVFVPLSFGLYQPFLKARQKRFTVDNHRYGTQPFRFTALNGDFFPPYLKAFGMVILWYVLAGGAGFMVLQNIHMNPHHPSPWPFYLLAAAIYLGVFCVAIYIATRVNNLVYNNTEIGGNRLHSALKAREMIGIYLSNTLAILCSAGMLIPWAMVRLARYRASRLTLLGVGNLDTFSASQTGEESAAASELDAVFDIDIGF